jgi:formamidopyrimidine-DNA glycosylase
MCDIIALDHAVTGDTMPEGPEVLRCGVQLSSIIKGKLLRQIKPISGKLSRKMAAIDINLIVTDVIVKGKTIFVQLADGREMVTTLGMSGWWYPAIDKVGDQKVYHQQKLIDATDVVLKALKHTRVELVMDDGNNAFYVDQRNFGNLKIVSKEEANAIRSRMGIEILTNKPIDGHAAVAALRRQGKREIGGVLLNQDVLCGIGNIYRAETLYICKINPFRQVDSLSTTELQNIIEVSAHVLNIAYHYEGKLVYPLSFLERMLKTRIPSDWDSVHGPLVYQRSTDLFGNEVNRSILAGRTLWWVPTIQV